MIDLLGNEEVDPKVRLAVAETFVVITKNLGFRKSFLRQKYFDVLVKVALKVIEEKDNPNEILVEICLQSIQTLINVNSLTSNRVYIPGESKIAERLRKCSFDQGTFILMMTIWDSLKDSESQFLKQVCTSINDKFIANIDYSDLNYMNKVLKALFSPQPVATPAELN